MTSSCGATQASGEPGATIARPLGREMPWGCDDEGDLYRAIFDTASEAVAVIEDGETIRAFNRRAERIFGYRAAEVVGQSVTLVLPQGCWTARAQNPAPGGGGPAQFGRRVFARRKDGSSVPLDLYAAEWSRGGRRFVTAKMHEAGDRKDVDRQCQESNSRLREASRMEALGRLAGGISHDFNNLLLAMGHLVEIAAATLPADAEAHEPIALVGRAVERAAALVAQILAFSRRDEPHRELVDLARIVDDAASLIEAAIPATIVLRRGRRARAEVLADATQLHQLVMNLAMNAADAIGDRAGRIDLDVEDMIVADGARGPVPPGAYARLTVRDDGIGMSADLVARAFEPFFTTKAEGEGTGLGLAVVHGIVAGHGGAVLIDSTPGAGTNVSVYLPRFTRTDPRLASIG